MSDQAAPPMPARMAPATPRLRRNARSRDTAVPTTDQPRIGPSRLTANPIDSPTVASPVEDEARGVDDPNAEEVVLRGVAKINADPDQDPSGRRRLVAFAHDAAGDHQGQRNERREHEAHDNENGQRRIAPHDLEALLGEPPPAPDPLHGDRGFYYAYPSLRSDDEAHHPAGRRRRGHLEPLVTALAREDLRDRSWPETPRRSSSCSSSAFLTSCCSTSCSRTGDGRDLLRRIRETSRTHRW